jgi:CRISPR-associated protein Csb2
MLTLEIEFLAGVCFAAKRQSSEDPDWPPQPDRVFSALVAAWGTRGERAEERAALEWLEQQPPPVIEASSFEPRGVGISYVPPNDPSGKADVIPDRRRRQARMFPAAVPHCPLLRLRWTSQPESSALEALRALARDTAYVGHSASIVRCRFVQDATRDTGLTEFHPHRRIYPGRLAALERDYRAGRRPLPGEAMAESPGASEVAAPESVFGARWIVFEDAGGHSPDLRGIAVVSRRLREALMSRYGAAGSPIPEFVSGHQPDASPTTVPHIAIVPMADAGFTHSEGRLMGLGVVIPRSMEDRRRNAERDWAGGLQGASETTTSWITFDRLLGEIAQLEFGPLGVWGLSRIIETRKESLRATRYLQMALRWASVTPIVLDRFPKAKRAAARDDEAEAIVAASCVNIGLPSPSMVRLSKHAAVKGAPSAYPSGNGPVWSGWTLPGNLSKRMLTHAVIEFSEPVRGPLLLGAGRFAGLGLCLPVVSKRT